MSWFGKKSAEAEVPETKPEEPPMLTEAQEKCAHTWHVPANGKDPVLCSHCDADRESFHFHPRTPRKA